MLCQLFKWPVRATDIFTLCGIGYRPQNSANVLMSYSSRKMKQLAKLHHREELVFTLFLITMERL